MKAFACRTRLCADSLRATLGIYTFLGSYLPAEAVDAAGADLVVHGHARAGTERGTTSGGVRVRSMAQPVIRRAFAVYYLGGRAAGR